MAGGEAERVTTAVGGAANPKFRPGGGAILYEGLTDPIAVERKARKFSARVYETFPIRFWNAWLDEKQMRLFVQAPAPGAKATDLLDGSHLARSPGFGGLFGIGSDQSLEAVWSPDGSEVVFAAAVNRNESMYAETETHLFRVPASGGEPARLTPAGQSFSGARFSPSGDALYVLHSKNPEKGRIYSLSRLARLPWPASGTPALLTGNWDRSVSAFHIARDGKAIYLNAEDDGFDKIFRVSSAGGAVELLFPVKEGGYTDAIPAGAGLVARYQSSVQPPQIVAVNVTRGMHSYLTSFDADRIAQIDWKPPEHFWFTARNGKRIHSILTAPPDFDPGRKYPVVVFPHGGPNSMSKDSFLVRWNYHLLTSPGYVLLQTNYTGSTGFGEKFADDIERDVLRGPAAEILEAIEEAARRYPFIDKTRQAAIGASYGGYLMNWFNGHTTQFKCLVNHAGAVNNESQYGVNDGGYGRELRMGTPIWEKGGQWFDQSPMRYAAGFKTPMLITQGELDYRVPLSESMTTYKLLLRLKVPTRLVLFPAEGHWILNGENHRFHMQEVLAWLKKYL
jgi:dipeptidyl aminopeptidase/acylaminoacyl peptidase